MNRFIAFSLLMLLSAAGYCQQEHETARLETIERMEAIANAVQAYCLETGKDKTPGTDITSLAEALKENGHLVDDAPLVDGWMQPLFYKPGAPGSFLLLSLGADREQEYLVAMIYADSEYALDLVIKGGQWAKGPQSLMAARPNILESLAVEDSDVAAKEAASLGDEEEREKKASPRKQEGKKKTDTRKKEKDPEAKKEKKGGGKKKKK